MSGYSQSDFVRSLKGKSNEELFAVLAHESDYLPEALDAVRAEIGTRNLDTETTALLETRVRDSTPPPSSPADLLRAAAYSLVFVAALFTISFAMDFCERYGIPQLESGTFHDRMVKRLERIGRQRPMAGPFIQQTLQTLDARGYMIQRYDARSPAFDDVRHTLMKRSGVVVHRDKRVIINLENSGQWSRGGCAGYNLHLDAVLLHEMVHVVSNRSLGIAGDMPHNAEDRLRLCLDPDVESSPWSLYLADVTEEALAHLVEDIIIAERHRGQRLPKPGDFSRPGQFWTLRLVHHVERRMEECFRRVFLLDVRDWSRRLTPEEAAILQERYQATRHSAAVISGVEEGLQRFGLL